MGRASVSKMIYIKWGKSFNGESGQQEFVLYFIFFDGGFHLFHRDRVSQRRRQAVGVARVANIGSAE